MYQSGPHFAAVDGKKTSGFAQNSGGIRLISFAELALMWVYAWGVPNTKELAMTKIDETTRTNRRLPAGTMVVSSDDGEPGRIVEVCTFRRNGIDAWSYLVETQHGREIWEVGELFVPDPQN